MNLMDLIGLKELTGVDFDTESTNDAQTIYFVLDGKTYAASEDPVDGYRSCMKDIIESKYKVKNKFRPCRVLGTMRDGGCDILDFIDVKTGKVVLSVGTDDADDYYPCWVARFTPENMWINRKHLRTPSPQGKE